MLEKSPSSWDRTVEVANVIGAIAILGGVAMTILGWSLAWPGWAIGASVMAIIMGAFGMCARLVSVRADSPIATIGEWKNGYIPAPKRKANKPRPQTNLTFMGMEYVHLYLDDNNVFWEISRGREKTPRYCVALRFGNEPMKGRPGQTIKNLRAGLVFHTSQREYAPIDRGSWVRESYNAIDLHVGDSRLLVIAQGLETPPDNMPPLAFAMADNHYGKENYGDPIFIQLDKPDIDLEVRLVAGDAGYIMYEHSFSLKTHPMLELGQKVTLVTSRPKQEVAGS